MATVPAGYIYHNGFWYAPDGTGPHFINSFGTAIRLDGPVFEGTWANLLAGFPASANTGERAVVTDPTYFTNSLRVRSDGTYWRLDGPQDLRVDFTPGTGIAGTTEQFLKQWSAPAGLLTALRYFSIKVLWAKSGTTDAVTNCRLRLGTTGTASDASLANGVIISPAHRSGATETILYPASSTQLRYVARGSSSSGTMTGFNGGASIDPYPNNITVANTDSNSLILSASIQMAGSTEVPTIAHLIVTGY